METATAGDLLREARIRHGLRQEDLAIRAGIARAVVSDIETDRISPTLELLGEDLVISAEERESGIDITLNQGNLKLSIEDRVRRGLAFADVVRENRRGGSDGLGGSLRVGPLLGAFARRVSDFVVIGGIAGLAHGSAYPTFDLDVAYAGCPENLNRLALALARGGGGSGGQSGPGRAERSLLRDRLRQS